MADLCYVARSVYRDSVFVAAELDIIIVLLLQ